MAFGGVVKLEGETQYRRALAQIMQSYKELQSELKLVTSQFDKNDKSQDALKAKTEAMTKLLEQQKAKLDLLNDRYAELGRIFEQQKTSIQSLTDKYRSEVSVLEELEKSVGKTSKEYKDQEAVVRNLENQLDKEQKANQDTEKAMSQLRTEMNNTKTEANNTARDIDVLGKETEESGKQAEEASEGYTILKGVIANLASEAIQKAIEGAKTLATKLIDVGKQSYSAFAEYEQLVGGVETLYGESAKTLEKYAADAYKTAGISANQYMRQSTLFAASLLQGLEGDTEKAVEYADLAIKDMADNANKMGTDIQSIQNAYQGFAKGTFTMLDNLRLGYVGTKNEMARLLNDTKVLGDTIVTVGQGGNFEQVATLDKMIEAVHIVQQQLGITGTTAKEAEGTITGSMGQVKAAFENLLVGFGDSKQDVRALTETVAKTIETMLKNAIPRIKQIVKGMWTSIKTTLRQYMPELANAIIPTLEKVGGAVKDIFTFIQKNGDTIIAIIKGVVTAFLAFKVAGMIEAATTALESFVGLSNPVGLMCTALAALVGLFVALEEIANKLPEEEAARRAAVDETTDRINDQVSSWEALRESHDKILQEKESEYSYYEGLWKELQKITDENGKIKEGYEKRAKYITDQLGKAYDIEIGIVDGVILKYGELATAIENVTKKKRAETILSTQEEAYQKAIKDAEAFRENLTAQKQNVEDQEAEVERLKKLIEERNEAYKKGATGVDAPTKYGGQNYYKDLEKAEKRLAELRESYQAGMEEAERARFAQVLYETNYENMLAGNYDAIIDTSRKYTADMKKTREERIDDLKSYSDYEQQIYRDAMVAYGKTSDDYYKLIMKDAQERKDLLKDQMAELGYYVEGIQSLSDTLSGISTSYSLQPIDKATAIDSLLNRGKDLTPEAIAQAMEGMQIVLDDEQVGRFVTKTVTRQVYATAR